MANSAAKIHSVSVRALAEFAFERGDLIPGAQVASRMRDGVRGHQVLQEMLPFSWQAEVSVSRDLVINGHILRVHGRADALYIDQTVVRVQEIKTTIKDPATILKYDYPVHWAQGEIYACLFCLNDHIDHAEVHLTYARLDGRRRDYVEEYMASELEERLMAYATPYLEWISAVDGWKEQSRPTLDALTFPFDSFREGQRDMAASVYLAMKNHANALIEAPTGIGKTAAALFGALKALGRGYITAVFYLTARTTGRKAAEDALAMMRARGLEIRSVTITAKEKICLLDKPDCMGCQYAAGYYDRRREALKEALAIESLDAEAIVSLAKDHDLCPFELSLDISETADVVICDYNYVFDPRVRLKRYFEGKSKAGILVDEAHNLADRAREMLSAEISGKRLSALRNTIAQFEGPQSPMVRCMDDLLEKLSARDVEMESLSDAPEELLEAVNLFVQQADALEPAEPEVVDFFFDAQWFVRLSGQFDAEHSRYLILPEGEYLSLQLWCFDPSGQLKKALSCTGGCALFSATLAPMAYYAHQLGADGEGDTELQLDSPFPPENLLVRRMSVAVGLKDRERTQHTVAHILHAMVEGRAGNYIACFPSYAYMTQVFRYYRMMWPAENVICQDSAMSEKQRMAFIERFSPAPTRSMLAFIVLGGVFAEGIDLPEDRLLGAAIVSTGMPQLSFKREMLAELLDDADDGGRDAAYTYPGIRRVLQAAGRVIRTEKDRGVVLLIDARYRQENIRALLPPHWDVREVKKLSELKRQMNLFWNGREADG